VLISTVIPTIGRRTLGRAVRTALEHGVGPSEHEVIVVNDSGSPLPAEAWADSPRVAIVTTQRRERCFARNVGAAIARGRYLHFLDDDDHLLPGGLAALLSVAERTGMAWVYGALQRMDDHGVPLSIDRPQIRGNVFVDLIAGETFHLGPSLIRADAFFRAGGFDPVYVVRQDLDLELRIALENDFERTDAMVAAVRVGPDGATSTNWSLAGVNSRRIREHMLDAPGAWARLLDSMGDSAFLHGRAVRAYGASAVQQASCGRLGTAARRLGVVTHLALGHFWKAEFRYGLRVRCGDEVESPSGPTRGARLRSPSR
jgi:glycosyltransferase involved in cell wall biosynthesis